MFGCLAVYVQDKIVLILRDKRDGTADNGVWLATTEEHHQSLRREFPNMRSIQVFGKKVTGWQVLPADAKDFEEAALRACELVLAGDPRIGKVPARRASRSGTRQAERSRSGRTSPRVLGTHARSRDGFEKRLRQGEARSLLVLLHALEALFKLGDERSLTRLQTVTAHDAPEIIAPRPCPSYTAITSSEGRLVTRMMMSAWEGSYTSVSLPQF